MMLARAVLIYLAGILGIILLIWALSPPARAQAGTDRATWFKSLRQPDTGYSCCNISDCRVTEDYEYQGGVWWVRTISAELVPVPPNKVITTVPPLPDGAVICHGVSGVIFCFVPPAMGW